MFFKRKYYILALLPAVVHATAKIPKTKDICHVESDYYWSGIWVPYGDNQLICDYWTINNLVFDNDENVTEDDYYEDSEIMDEINPKTESDNNEEYEHTPAIDRIETESDN
ncbi:hypothetical protein FW755_09320 [Lonepinella koalarum]|uniref:hypothetical protein n=1 Tax=Lonepinella koalarum TaxID=53417 RepID=UPI0011E48DBA|nr:hypothetical protein [Lonepinella koalarum]TYG35276.1 hypothetical protein FW755_09320 [Lonepinella koalarum]